jgi:type IV secretion system protein VirB8
MISEVNKAIAEHIDSGKYFEDARDWYISKYVMLFSIRALYAIIALIIGISAHVIFDSARQDYTVKQYPFSIYAEDELKYFPLIKSIARKKEPINLSVAKYLASQYVELRENYKFSNQVGEEKDKLLMKISSLSTKKVYRDYLNYMDPNLNPDSPLVVYKNVTQRIVSVKEITSPNNKNVIPDNIEVKFEASEIDKEGNIIKTNWIAEVEFSMSDIDKVFDKTETLNFIVTKYYVRKYENS